MLRARRLALHELLCTTLGSRHVYYQPPESVKLVYPCIIYFRSDLPHRPADDLAYLHTREYEITVIDEDPDSDIVERVSKLPRCRFGRHYTSERLNHDTFTIIY